MLKPTIVDCDVAVVGAGAAGMMAALTAAECGARVCGISKMPARAPSCTTRAYGDITWCDRSSHDELFRQVVETGGFLGNQELVEQFVASVTRALARLRVMGVALDEPRRAGPGMPGTVRCCYRGIDAGQELLDRVHEHARGHRLQLMHGLAAVEVLVHEGAAVGLVTVDLKRRTATIFRAPRVVLATGGGAGIFARTDNPPGTCGDGIALAYDAGAELVDLELISFGYPRERVCDVLERGIQLREELLDLGHAHYFLGGVRVRPGGQTSIAGLHAAGEVTGGLFGAGRLGGSALADCLIGGMAAGAWRGYGPGESSRVELPGELMAAALDRVETIVRGTDRPRPLHARIRDICWRGLGPVKTEASITRVLEELDEIAPAIAFCGGAEREAIRLAVEVRHMHTVAELVARASLERRETRGCYWRADHPQPDNATQLQNIVLRRGHDGCELTREPPVWTRLTRPTEPRIGAGCFDYMPRRQPD